MSIKQTIPTNSGDYIQFGNSTTPVAAQIGGYEDSTGNGHLELYTTAGGVVSERARLDSAGNFGLGVTPSAWGASYKVLEFSNAGNSLWSTGVGDARLGTNFYFDGASSIYKTTAAAAQYRQSGGIHYWYTAPSGTAGNVITFTQAMTLDASGRLSLGTTTASSGYSSISLVGGPSGAPANTGIQLTYNASTYGGGAMTTVNAAGGGLSFYTFTGNVGSESYSERMRIDSSGNLLFRTTTSGSGNKGWAFLATAHSDFITTVCGSLIDGATHLSFQTAGVQKGYIAVSGGSTIYATSSDYRLKENIVPLTGGLNKIMQLKPVSYRWIEEQVDSQGFIAHELQEIVPQAVTGEKDAVDADGNPVYQGIDTSFLVATLTAAIQEQQTIIQSLTARLEALEAK